MSASFEELVDIVSNELAGLLVSTDYRAGYPIAAVTLDAGGRGCAASCCVRAGLETMGRNLSRVPGSIRRRYGCHAQPGHIGSLSHRRCAGRLPRTKIHGATRFSVTHPLEPVRPTHQAGSDEMTVLRTAFVFGASGFIGRWVVREVPLQGVVVCAAVRTVGSHARLASWLSDNAAGQSLDHLSKRFSRMAVSRP